MKTRYKISIIGVVLTISISLFVVWSISDTNLVNPTFLEEYPQIRQNDMFCWTQWYLENTTINESELISSIQKTIAGFGSHVDVPEREITVSHNEEETVISIAGIWIEDQNQHEELTSVIKNHIGDSKIIRDDIIMCE